MKLSFPLSCKILTIFYKLGQKYDKERSHQVVDSLHIAARWMSDGPDIQDALKYLQHTNNTHLCKTQATVCLHLHIINNF